MVRQDLTKEKIIAFATERFLQEGFSKISVDEIASDLGMSKKTFYKFFNSKEDLLTQIVDRFLAAARGRITRIMDSDKNFIEKIADVTSFLNDVVNRFGRPIQVDMQRHAPALWKRIEDFRRQRITQQFRYLFEQGLEEGFVRKDVNQRVFLLAYIGAVEAIIAPSVLVNESFSAREALRNIMAIFFHGILTEEASKRLSELQDIQRSQSL